MRISKEEKLQYMQKLIDRSARDFDFKRSIKEDDKMITLSTCDDYSYNGRLIVHGILEEEIKGDGFSK